MRRQLFAPGLALRDLGVRVTEQQVPHLFFLLAEVCSVLHVDTMPRLHVLNHSQPGIFYL